MARDLTSGVQVELSARVNRPIFFYEGEFVSGPLRLWSGIVDVDWNGNTWTGAGLLAGVSTIKETADVTAQGLTASMSGMPSDLIAKVHTETRHGQSGKVWLGFMDADDNIIADPYLAFSGRLDVPAIQDSGDTCAISIQYESRLVDLQRARIWRYTHESQQALYPDDLGFEYVASLQNQELQW
jgi:hypothetical protein